jgi:hypothetical protein
MSETSPGRLSDDEFIARFDAGTLDGFPHESHLRLVYSLLQRKDAAAALEHVRSGIRAMAERNGNPGAYHDTRTVAWFRLVQTSAGDTTGAWTDDFLASRPHLVRRDLLSDFYSPELLNSEGARAAFLHPDIKPLP